MNATTKGLLIMQGYSEADICDCKNITALARWTPSACALAGTLGVLFRSPVAMAVLGLLTLIGAVTSRSFFDYLYIFLVKPVMNLGEMPLHGNPRRFGCAIGAALFTLTGIGLFIGNAWLTYVPALTIIPLALVAALTQWCFASALYAMLRNHNSAAAERR